MRLPLGACAARPREPVLPQHTRSHARGAARTAARRDRDPPAPRGAHSDRAIRGVTPALSACRRPLHRRLRGEWKAYRVTAAIARNSHVLAKDSQHASRPRALAHAVQLLRVWAKGKASSKRRANGGDPHPFNSDRLADLELLQEVDRGAQGRAQAPESRLAHCIPFGFCLGTQHLFYISFGLRLFALGLRFSV